MNYQTYKVVGVTFENRQDLIRQAWLKEVRGDDIDFNVEPYEYEGEPAMAVMVDGEPIGNIAKDEVLDFMDKYEQSVSVRLDFARRGITAAEVVDAKDILADREGWDKEDIREAKELVAESKELEDDDICSATIRLEYPEEEQEPPKKKGLLARLTGKR